MRDLGRWAAVLAYGVIWLVREYARIGYRKLTNKHDDTWKGFPK